MEGLSSLNLSKGIRNGLPYIAGLAIIHAVAILLYLTSVHHGFLFGGIGLVCYTLGLRHAFDVDHIAAIDNAIRKLIHQCDNPSGAGFYFSLGHSAVVFLMVLISIDSYQWAQQHMPYLKQIGGIIGMLVSGSFLLLIGIMNLVVLKGIYKIYKEGKNKNFEEEKVDHLLLSRGFINRFASPLFKMIRKSWYLFPLGFLFGLGFDTASEVAILAFSIETANQAVSITGVLSLPLLFASGMCLLDTADGLFMQSAYQWSFSNPLRKIYYNLLLTALSVLVAFFIGGFEWIQVILAQINFKVGLWNGLGKLSFHWLGYTLAGFVIAVWILSFLIWKWIHIDKRSRSKEIN